ncbi:MAG: ABC transporter permease [Armatimonadota bacterium]
MGSRTGIIPPGILPGPSDIGWALIQSLREDALLQAVGDSMQLMFIGYLLSVVLGVPLGAMIYQVPGLRRTLGAALLGLQTLPSVCWLPLALLWFGGSIHAVLFVVLANSTFSIATATSGALAQVPPLYIQAGQTLGARGWALSLRVLFPGALPGIVTGLRIGWTFAWRALMAGELIYPHAGLGRLLQQGRVRGDIAEILATMLLIMALGLLVEVVFFSRVDNTLRRRWGLEPV